MDQRPSKPSQLGQAREAGRPPQGSRGCNASQRLPGLAFGLPLLLLPFLLVSPVSENSRLILAFSSVAGALALWGLFLWMRDRRERASFRLELVPPQKSHYIQGSVQLCIYAYWGWYWPRVAQEIPLIVSQLVFLYVFDAFLSWSRGRNWRLGFAPLPIILSTNIFIWFKDDYFICQFLMIATCSLGKEFIKWTRDGRKVHIFNPSAFGLAVFSFVLIVTGTTQYTWGVEVASTLALPPHIYLEIFLLGLIVQYFFSVTLMTLSATAVLCLLNLIYTGTTGVYHFLDTNIPIAIFLGLHLLVTDPATSPRSNAGRVIFGALYGAANFVLFGVLSDFGIPDFYDKLIPVPILNLLVPWIDRVSRSGFIGRFSNWEARFRPRTLNLVHMGCWAGLFLAMLASGFVEAPHAGASIEFWRKAQAEGKPRAAQNLFRIVASMADKGSATACNDMGVMYLQGELVPHDSALAAYYFSRAWGLGDMRGCSNLAGQFLFQPDPAPHADVPRALDQLEQQCGNGQAQSCYFIGYAYETGKGRPLDKARALQLYDEACRLGNPNACKSLARLRLAMGGEGDIGNAEQVLSAACEKGDAQSCMSLALLYRAGNGVPRDEARARTLLQRACSLGAKAACETVAGGPALAESPQR